MVIIILFRFFPCSHLITIPAGVSPLDALMSSPLMHQNIAYGSGTLDGNGGGSGADDFGNIDPSLEPELAMALRVSAEEARAREEARVRYFAYVILLPSLSFS